MPENNQDIEIRSESVQDILTAVPSWMIRWGNTLLFILIIMVFILSWLIKYPDVIPSQASVTTAIPPEKIIAKATGKIQKIFIANEHDITENTAIAVIENTALYQDVFLLQGIMDSITLNKSSFRFPLEELPILFLGDIETDFALFENSYSQYELQRQLQPYSYENLANENSLKEMRLRLKSTLAQEKISKEELALTKTNMDRQQSLLDQGIISQLTFEQKQKEYLGQVRALESMQLSISQLKEAISNGNKNKTSTRITQSKEEMQQFRAVIQSFNQLKKSIKDWDNRYVIRSNTSGKVIYLGFQNQNDVVQQGVTVCTILPNETENYIAKMSAPAKNSGKIKVGQKVQISLENFPKNEYGVLNGTIAHISALPDEEGNYAIRVALPESMITSYNKAIPFRQEMVGSASIITEDLRLIERLFYDLRGIFGND